MTTISETSRYGAAFADAWDRVHPRLTRRGGWAGHVGPLPVIEGTAIRLRVDRLPGDRNPKPVWLWASMTGLTGAGVDRIWQAYLRRYPPGQARDDRLALGTSTSGHTHRSARPNTGNATTSHTKHKRFNHKLRQ